MTTMPTCDIYLRLSDARVEEAFEGREAKLRTLADVLGWTVFRVVVENDIDAEGNPKRASAWKRRKIRTPSGRTELRVIRPAFRSVLDDLETGRANSLLAEDLDRVFRDPRDLEDFIDIMEGCDGNARSLSGSLTFTNGGTGSEIDMARMLVTMANKSSRDTSRRVKSGRDRWHGKSFFGGRRPFGYFIVPDTDEYKRTLGIIPDEQRLIEKAAADVLDRDISLRAIAKEWRTNGVRQVNGKCAWNTHIVKRCLTKPTVAGLQTHNGELKDAPWPAILDVPTWEKLCAKLNDPARQTNGGSGNEPRWLASKIATCGVCDTPVIVTGSDGHKHVGPGYHCPEKYCVRRNATHTDAWIERNVTAYISRYGPDILKPEPRQDINADALRAEAKDLRKRQGEQLELHRLGLIDITQLQRELRAFKDRLTVIDAQLAKSDQPDPLPEFRHHGPTRKIWSGLSLARKRAILRQLVEIKIYPTSKRGRGFDPDSVRIIIRETGDVLDVRDWPADDDVTR